MLYQKGEPYCDELHHWLRKLRRCPASSIYPYRHLSTEGGEYDAMVVQMLVLEDEDETKERLFRCVCRNIFTVQLPYSTLLASVMGLFDASPNKISPTELHQLKGWVYEALTLDGTVPVSISQLKCAEPGCPPLETIIAVMSQPPQTYKIHRPAGEIEKADVIKAIGLSIRDKN